MEFGPCITGQMMSQSSTLSPQVESLGVSESDSKSAPLTVLPGSRVVFEHEGHLRYVERQANLVSLGHLLLGPPLATRNAVHR